MIIRSEPETLWNFLQRELGDWFQLVPTGMFGLYVQKNQSPDRRNEVWRDVCLITRDKINVYRDDDFDTHVKQLILKYELATGSEFDVTYRRIIT